MRYDKLRKKPLAAMISFALLPFSVCAEDIEIADKENVSAIWSLNQSVTPPAASVKATNGNITVNGSVNVDSSNIPSYLAKYVIYTQGSNIDLGHDSTITSDNSANVITVEGGGLVSGSNLDISGVDENYGSAMANLFGINTIAPADNATGTFINFAGITRLSLNNFTGDAAGILAECASGTACNTDQTANIQLENLGLNLIASGNATGIKAQGQNIAFNESTIVVNSDNVNAAVNGLVADNGTITATGYTDLSVSGKGALTAVAASGERANIDLQDGTAITLYRDAGTEQGAKGIVASDGALVHLRDSWLTLFSDAGVADTDRFLVAQNSSNIVVDGALTAVVDDTAVKPASAVYVGAEGDSAIELNGTTTLGDLRNADIATAFLAKDSGRITLDDQRLTAWGNITADNGAVALRTADNSYLYSTISTVNNGTVDLSLNGANSLWDMTGSSTVSSLALNSGTINFVSDASSQFKTLTVEGDYSGNGGTLVMNVTLNGDDDSPGDRMIVKGDTSGATGVKFNNIYGHGEHTDMGIELISVGGNSAGQFALDRRVGIGLYDYALVQKGQNWYLSNSLEDITPGETPAADTEADDGNATPETPATPPADEGNSGTTPETPVTPPADEGNTGTTPETPATPPTDEGNTGTTPETPATPPADEGNTGTTPETPANPPADEGNTGTTPETPANPPAEEGNTGTTPETPVNPPADEGNTGTTPETPANPPADEGNTGTTPENPATPPADSGEEGAAETPSEGDESAQEEANNPDDDDAPASEDENSGESATTGSYDYVKVYRPESGSYIANMAAANTLFLTRLHDRQGEHAWVDPITGERHLTTMWMRNSASHNRFEEAGGQLISRSNNYTLQIGSDVARWSTTGEDSLRLGVMAGYASSNSKSRSQITGYTSRGKANGYSAGLYATWFADDATRTGAWVDSWVLYNWFDNEVSGHEMRTEKYHSRGITASLEAGYALPVGTSERFSYWLEPRGQAVLMNVKADDLTEEQGTRVSGIGDGNIMTQLGIRAWMKGMPEKGVSDSVKPYIETNWVHNTRAFGVRMNGESNTMLGSKNLLEARVGVEGQMSDRLALWVDAGHQVGHNKYSESRGSLGIKYQF